MNIVITGGAGFLGLKLAHYLLSEESPITIEHITLVDVVAPQEIPTDPRLQMIITHLNEHTNLHNIITPSTDAVFHLAAIVSGQAEADFDLGMNVNFDLTRSLLQHIRHTNPKIRFIFSSSLAVFGGDLPSIINNHTVLTPQSSYGAQKAMAELLIQDYHRKQFLHGIVLRLPTISIRPGLPNQAASSFASSIIREPLNGKTAICPVQPDLSLWLASPSCVIKNLAHALTIEHTPYQLSIHLPGIHISVEQMLNSLKKIAGEAVYKRVQFIFDQRIHNIVASWPNNFDIQPALALGFKKDQSFENNINEFIRNSIS